MFNYTRIQINDIANSGSFIVNTTEKVLRLYDILEYIRQSKIKDMLALKGGTAINLWLLNLPRLSVDIDLDFTIDCSREEMMSYREQIRKIITGYMNDEGYVLSDRSKFVHSLDSFVYGYATLSNSRDVLKIEINYSDRVHIYDPVEDKSSAALGRIINVRRLADNELIGSKVNALIVRTTPRDIYDVYTLLNAGMIKNEDLIKKIAVFYAVLGSERPIDFDKTLSCTKEKISRFNYNIARETLIPVLRKGVNLEIDDMVDRVNTYLQNSFVLTNREQEYINRFNEGIYLPELLFEGYDINDITKHPMALWKTL